MAEPAAAARSADTATAPGAASDSAGTASSRGARLGEQIKRHGVALISLCVALISLSYNTWRNETTESHRNTRAAGFRILIELGELQQVVDYTAYFQLESTGARGNSAAELWVSGWGKVAMIRDLSQLLSDSNARAGAALFQAWESQAEALRSGINASAGANAEAQISAQIRLMRESTLETLQALE